MGFRYGLNWPGWPRRTVHLTLIEDWPQDGDGEVGQVIGVLVQLEPADHALVCQVLGSSSLRDGQMLGHAGAKRASCGFSGGVAAILKQITHSDSQGLAGLDVVVRQLVIVREEEDAWPGGSAVGLVRPGGRSNQQAAQLRFQEGNARREARIASPTARGGQPGRGPFLFLFLTRRLTGNDGGGFGRAFPRRRLGWRGLHSPLLLRQRGRRFRLMHRSCRGISSATPAPVATATAHSPPPAFPSLLNCIPRNCSGGRRRRQFAFASGRLLLRTAGRFWRRGFHTSGSRGRLGVLFGRGSHPAQGLFRLRLPLRAAKSLGRARIPAPGAVNISRLLEIPSQLEGDHGVPRLLVKFREFAAGVAARLGAADACLDLLPIGHMLWALYQRQPRAASTETLVRWCWSDRSGHKRTHAHRAVDSHSRHGLVCSPYGRGRLARHRLPAADVFDPHPDAGSFEQQES